METDELVQELRDAAQGARESVDSWPAFFLDRAADELERLRAQVSHLVDDLTEEVADEDEVTYYRLRDGKDVLFSNMVGACTRLLAAQQPMKGPTT